MNIFKNAWRVKPAPKRSEEISRLRRGVASCLLDSLNSWRAQKFLCDFVVKIGDKEFACHKIALAGCSEYFRVLFNTEVGNGCVTNETTLNGIDHLNAETFEIILQFAYKGELNITSNNALVLLKNGDFFGMKLLVAKCKKYIIKDGNVKNLLEICAFAYHPLNDELFRRKVTRKVTRCISNCSYEVLESKDFLCISFEMLNSILQEMLFLEAIRPRSQVELFPNDSKYAFILEWIQHDPAVRMECFDSLAVSAALPEKFVNLGNTLRNSFISVDHNESTSNS